MATYIDGVLLPPNLTDTEFKYWCEAHEARRKHKADVLYWKWAAFLSGSFCSSAATFITRIMHG